MMTDEDIEKLNETAQEQLVKTLKEEIISLKAQLKEKDDQLKLEIQYKIQERKKWQEKQT